MFSSYFDKGLALLFVDLVSYSYLHKLSLDVFSSYVDHLSSISLAHSKNRISPSGIMMKDAQPCRTFLLRFISQRTMGWLRRMEVLYNMVVTQSGDFSEEGAPKMKCSAVPQWVNMKNKIGVRFHLLFRSFYAAFIKVSSVRKCYHSVQKRTWSGIGKVMVKGRVLPHFLHPSLIHPASSWM